MDTTPKNNWFPLREDMLTDPTIQSMSGAGRIYALSALDDFNHNGGGFYRADIEYAVLCGVDLKSIRRYRKRLAEAGLLEHTPGYRRSNGSGKATEYNAVKYATPPAKGDGIMFAGVPRYTWQVARDYLMKKAIGHDALAVYMALHLARHKYGETPFFVCKSELSLWAAVNVRKLLDALSQFRDNTSFTGGSNWIDFEDRHQQIAVTHWSEPSNPDECEHNRERRAAAEARRQRLFDEARQGTRLAVNKQAKEYRERFPGLSTAELRAVALFADGATYKEIGAELGMTQGPLLRYRRQHPQFQRALDEVRPS